MAGNNLRVGKDMGEEDMGEEDSRRLAVPHTVAVGKAAMDMGKAAVAVG